VKDDSLASAVALTVVSALADDQRHEFRPDDVAYSRVSMRGVVGQLQVTDAYLVQLARQHDGRLATFDQGLARLHNDTSYPSDDAPRDGVAARGVR